MNHKLTRSTSDKILSGVLGGLARHYNLNVFWLRLGVALGALFTSGLFIIGYIVASFILPKDSDDNS
ncbi:MAG: PspC domain-containing protein [Bacteroidetes bacterium]|nr:PspC domain-containing protein [Bacteroidota bacterium]MCY4234558.1 PspC domain-containing protein [Bacteroidota bacterium]